MINVNKIEIPTREAVKVLQAIRSIGVTPLDMKVSYRLGRIGNSIESRLRSFYAAVEERKQQLEPVLTALQEEVNKYGASTDAEQKALAEAAANKIMNHRKELDKQTGEALDEIIALEIPIVSIEDLNVQEDRVMFRTITKEGGVQENVREEYKKGQPAIDSHIMIMLVSIIACQD